MIDIVISHYKENLSWINNINIDCNIKIYSKTLDNGIVNNCQIIKQPFNIGNESSSYLNYIVDNYNNLPEYIYFCHGHNFSEHQDFTNDFLINNIDYKSFDYLNVNNYYNIIDSKKTVTLLKYEKVTDNKPYVIIDYFYEKFFSQFSQFSQIEDEYNSFSCAQFFIKRELILSNSLDFYNKCLQWFYSSKSLELDRHFVADDNIYSSRIFEWLWFYIFTKEKNEKIIRLNELFEKNKKL